MHSALQDVVDPDGICYGCGPVNPEGLRIKSHWADDNVHVVALITPDPKYSGWPGLVYGGFLAMIVDCHSNWTGIAYHYRAEGREPGSLPKIGGATATLQLTYRKPTPMGVPLHLSARVEGAVGRKTRVLCEVWAGDVLTVTGDSVFARIDEDLLTKTMRQAR